MAAQEAIFQAKVDAYNAEQYELIAQKKAMRGNLPGGRGLQQWANYLDHRKVQRVQEEYIQSKKDLAAENRESYQRFREAAQDHFQENRRLRVAQIEARRIARADNARALREASRDNFRLFKVARYNNAQTEKAKLYYLNRVKRPQDIATAATTSYENDGPDSYYAEDTLRMQKEQDEAKGEPLSRYSRMRNLAAEDYARAGVALDRKQNERQNVSAHQQEVKAMYMATLSGLFQNRTDARTDYAEALDLTQLATRDQKWQYRNTSEHYAIYDAAEPEYFQKLEETLTALNGEVITAAEEAAGHSGVVAAFHAGINE